MLAGRNDLEFVKHYVKRMETFSDDGVILHGAYGYRWRKHFDMEGGGRPDLPDQLVTIIGQLRANPDDRRCVLQMWDPVADLNRKGKDVPCNLSVLFWMRYAPLIDDNVLDMTVFCRSNDMIWGGYGANAVHFSILQEYVASAIGCAVGEMWQISNNYHVYTNVFDPLYEKMEGGLLHNPYENVAPYPLVNWPIVASNKMQPYWDQDLHYFVDNALEEGQFVHKFTNSFFTDVADPMRRAHNLYRATTNSKLNLTVKQKLRCFDDAISTLSNCKAEDWQKAGVEWLQRRAAKFKKENDDGPTYE